MASDIETAFKIRLASDIDISKKKAHQGKTAVCKGSVLGPTLDARPLGHSLGPI